MSAKIPREKTYRSRQQISPLIARLKLSFTDREIHFGGSWRRGAPEVGDLDVLLISEEGALPQDLETRAGDLTLIEARGDRLAHFTMKDVQGPFHVDFYAATPRERGAFLWFITGPQSLNIAMRWDAKQKGLLLSQYGLFVASTRHYVAGHSEISVAQALGPQWIELLTPESRQVWAPPRTNVQHVLVRGSKGSVYMLKIEGRQITCDCPGYQFRRHCRHIDEYRAAQNVA